MRSGKKLFFAVCGTVSLLSNLPESAHAQATEKPTIFNTKKDKEKDCVTSLKSISKNADNNYDLEISITIPPNEAVDHKIMDDDGAVVANILLQKYLENSKKDMVTKDKNQKSADFTIADKELLTAALDKMGAYASDGKAVAGSGKNGPIPLTEEQIATNTMKDKQAAKLWAISKKLNDGTITIADINESKQAVTEYVTGSLYPKTSKFQLNYEIDGESTMIKSLWGGSKGVISSDDYGDLLFGVDLNDGSYDPNFMNESCKYYSVQDTRSAKPKPKTDASGDKSGRTE